MGKNRKNNRTNELSDLSLNEFMEAMQESTERSMQLKGFDLSTKEGLIKAEKYLQTEDSLISGFDSPPIDYLAMGLSPEEAAAATELDAMVGEFRVRIMLTCLEERKGQMAF